MKRKLDIATKAFGWLGAYSMALGGVMAVIAPYPTHPMMFIAIGGAFSALCAIIAVANELLQRG